MRIEYKNGELVIVDFDEREAYKIACKIEKDGIFFYKKLCARIDKEDTRKALSFLLEEEGRHLKLFEDALWEAEKAGGAVNEDDDLLDGMNSGVFQPYESIKDLEKALSDTAKALRLGIIIEDKSIKFYGACRKNISSEKAKAALTFIIEEEKRHKELLGDISV